MVEKKVKKCYASNIAEFEKWFEENHDREDRVQLICYKRHTGKPALNQNESMKVAICFGWIDTIIKRIDDDKFLRTFVKRKKDAGWSKNTLRYAEEMVKEGRMRPSGMEAYERGLKKRPMDHNLPRNPDALDDLAKVLKKEGLFEKFEGLSPSQKRYSIYWLESGKRRETRDKRIEVIVEKVRKGERVF